jgi:hypothetical protein
MRVENLDFAKHFYYKFPVYGTLRHTQMRHHRNLYYTDDLEGLVKMKIVNLNNSSYNFINRHQSGVSLITRCKLKIPTLNNTFTNIIPPLTFIIQTATYEN